MTVKVLDGVRVIDLGSYISAPYAAMLLAELGADVVKVERPEATDPSRNHVVNSKSPVFSAFNRNKRSLLIDYSHPKGLAVLEKMAQAADVLLINVRPGVEKKLGVDAERMQALNPRLIHCAITGFGATGPYARRPAYDNVGQVLSGVLSRFHQGADPRIAGPTISDSVTGMHACIGILGALYERSHTGKGRKVEVNLLESMIAFATEPLIDILFSGKDQPFYYRGGVSQAYVLTCRDGKRIGLHLSSPDKFWQALTKAIERPALAERFPTAKLRIEHYAEIAETLAAIFATRDRDEWQPILEAHDVPFAPERRLNELSADPQIQHLRTFADVDENRFGAGRMPNRAIRYDGDNNSVFKPAPAKGEHTDEILSEFGVDTETISNLRQSRIIA